MAWMRVELDDWRIVRERLIERETTWLDEEIAIDLRYLEARIQARGGGNLPYEVVVDLLPSDRALATVWRVSRRRARRWLDHPELWRDPFLGHERSARDPFPRNGT